MSEEGNYGYSRHLTKTICIYHFTSHSGLTLDKLGIWEYLARFSLDKFINGPSGLVNIEA